MMLFRTLSVSAFTAAVLLSCLPAEGAVAEPLHPSGTGAQQTLARTDQSIIHYYRIPPVNTEHDSTLLYILQGSDCNSVINNNAILTDYRNVWPAADLLLIEKYGIDHTLPFNADAGRADCPAAYLQHDNPQQRVADSGAVLNRLLADNRYQRLILLGGSEGALIANLISKARHDITATIAFNGGGRWFIDDVLHSINATVPVADERVAAIQGFREFAEHIQQPAADDIVVSGHGINWWRQMLALDQQAVLQTIASPLLIIQSQRDQSVSPGQVETMMNALKDAGKHNIRFIRYPSLNHQLNNTDGSSGRLQVIQDIALWLKTIGENQ